MYGQTPQHSEFPPMPQVSQQNYAGYPPLQDDRYHSQFSLPQPFSRDMARPQGSGYIPRHPMHVPVAGEHPPLPFTPQHTWHSPQPPGHVPEPFSDPQVSSRGYLPQHGPVAGGYPPFRSCSHGIKCIPQQPMNGPLTSEGIFITLILH